MPEELTLKEAADSLGVRVKSLRNRIARGKLKARRRGRLLYVRREDLAAVAKNQTKKNRSRRPPRPAAEVQSESDRLAALITEEMVKEVTPALIRLRGKFYFATKQAIKLAIAEAIDRIVREEG